MSPSLLLTLQNLFHVAAFKKILVEEFHSEVNPCSPTHKLASSEIWFTSDSSIFSNKLGCFW